MWEEGAAGLAPSATWQGRDAPIGKHSLNAKGGVSVSLRVAFVRGGVDGGEERGEGIVKI